MARVGVVGGGAFGTAMACVIRRAGHDTRIWVREADVAADINRSSVNPMFLPGVALLPGIWATSELSDLGHQDLIVLAPPAQHMRFVTTQLRPFLKAGTPVVTCSKGIERITRAFMVQVIADTLPEARIAVLSGPSFAGEIAVGLPTGVTLACADIQLGEQICQAIGSARFRTYRSSDVIGAQIGGVLKNVLAIASGIAVAKKLGNNARATLVARGLSEMASLGLALGAQAETFMGLAGIGDLDLSCNSPHSRNMSLGIALGEGRRAADVLGEKRQVHEGVHSAEGIAALAKQHSLDMPICQAVDAVLNRGAEVNETIERLLAHPYEYDSGPKLASRLI